MSEPSIWQALREAALAVVDRWQTPDWTSEKGKVHTGELIDALERALAASSAAKPQQSVQELMRLADDFANASADDSRAEYVGTIKQMEDSAQRKVAAREALQSALAAKPEPQQAVEAARWLAMRENLVSVDWNYMDSGEPVAIFMMHGDEAVAGPEGADAIADAAMRSAHLAGQEEKAQS